MRYSGETRRVIPLRRPSRGVGLCVVVFAVLSLLLASCGGDGGSMRTSGSVSIAPFQGDKRAAVSFTFDDGLRDQVTIAVPIFNEAHVPATFFVIAGYTPDTPGSGIGPAANKASWEEWRQVAAAGHEIGNHSMTHPSLVTITDPTVLDTEITGAGECIAEKMGAFPYSFACPYTAPAAHIRRVALQRHRAVRDDYTGYGDYNGRLFTAAEANALVDNAIRNGTWLVPVMHGVDGRGYCPISSTVLREHLAYVRSHDRDLWVDTYAHVSQYRTEAAATHIVPVEITGSSLTFRLESALAPSTADVPLTVVVRLPTSVGAGAVQATRDGLSLVTTRSGDNLLIDLHPGSSPIVISWG